MATHFAILPDGIIQTLSLQLGANPSQFLSLPHPRTGLLALFLPTPDTILELQSVSPVDGRSWFLSDEVVEDGKLIVMTPIDPAFLLIRLLQISQGKIFRQADDLFEEITKTLLDSEASELKDKALLERSIMAFSNLPCVAKSLRSLCDTQEFGPETAVYRNSPEKTKLYLRTKIARVEASKVLDSSRTVIRHLAKEGLMEDGNENLLSMGRTKAAFDLIAHYMSPELKKSLLETYDFAELDKYIQDNMDVPLRSATNKKEQVFTGTKAEIEKKRKAAARGSHGVEQLKKANTTGMSKLSSFFNKVDKPVTKRKK